MELVYPQNGVKSYSSYDYLNPAMGSSIYMLLICNA